MPDLLSRRAFVAPRGHCLFPCEDLSRRAAARADPEGMRGTVRATPPVVLVLVGGGFLHRSPAGLIGSRADGKGVGIGPAADGWEQQRGV